MMSTKTFCMARSRSEKKFSYECWWPWMELFERKTGVLTSFYCLFMLSCFQKRALRRKVRLTERYTFLNVKNGTLGPDVWENDKRAPCYGKCPFDFWKDLIRISDFSVVTEYLVSKCCAKQVFQQIVRMKYH